MTDITPIIQALIALILGIIGLLISKSLLPYIRSKMSADGFAKFLQFVGIGVSAAEQIYRAAKQGAEKKAYVLKFLNDNGFDYDEDIIDNAIEAAVQKLKPPNK